MKEYFAILMGAALLVLMIPILYRIITGPTGFDRILGVNVIGTKTAVILVIIGTLFERVDMFVDFAIAYALLNFVAAIVVSRYFNRTVPLHEMEEKLSATRQSRGKVN
jgi:multicomponent Na+:H+ antiporter subunit F